MATPTPENPPVKAARDPSPFDASFEAGYVPIDEPPGFEERAYRSWKEAGGVALSNCQSCCPELDLPPEGAAVYWDQNRPGYWWYLSVPVPDGVRAIGTDLRDELLTMEREEADRKLREAGDRITDRKLREVGDRIRMRGGADRSAGGSVSVGSHSYVDDGGARMNVIGPALDPAGKAAVKAGWRSFALCSRFLEMDGLGLTAGPSMILRHGWVSLPPFRFLPKVLRVGRETFILDESEAEPKYVTTTAVTVSADSIEVRADDNPEKSERRIALELVAKSLQVDRCRFLNLATKGLHGLGDCVTCVAMPTICAPGHMLTPAEVQLWCTAGLSAHRACIYYGPAVVAHGGTFDPPPAARRLAEVEKDVEKPTFKTHERCE